MNDKDRNIFINGIFVGVIVGFLVGTINGFVIALWL